MPDPTVPFFLADPITGTQVIYAPARAERSNAFARDAFELPGGPCPFCPGNEAETPPEIWALRPESSAPDTPGWQLRLVPNRYPAIAHPIEGGGIATGRHEVLIESPCHDLDWTTMSVNQLTYVLLAVQSRLTAYAAETCLQSAQVFKNVGIRSGASLAHPHLQLIALGASPSSEVREQQRCRAWLEQNGQDYWSALIGDARREGRVVFEDEDSVALCPRASRVPYETWILPRRPEMTWATAVRSEFVELACHLGEVIRLLYRALGPVAHNLIWRLPPLLLDPIPAFRWRIELLPRLTTFGGFELGAGIYSNPILPTRAAAVLRGEITPYRRNENKEGAGPSGLAPCS